MANKGSDGLISGRRRWLTSRAMCWATVCLAFAALCSSTVAVIRRHGAIAYLRNHNASVLTQSQRLSSPRPFLNYYFSYAFNSDASERVCYISLRTFVGWEKNGLTPEIRSALRHTPELCGIDLRSTSITPQQLGELLCEFPLLNEVSFGHSTVHDNVCNVLKSPRLRAVTIEDSQITGPAIIEMLRNCPNIAYLDISGSKFSDHDARALLQECGPPRVGNDKIRCTNSIRNIFVNQHQVSADGIKLLQIAFPNAVVSFSQ